MICNWHLESSFQISLCHLLPPIDSSGFGLHTFTLHLLTILNPEALIVRYHLYSKRINVDFNLLPETFDVWLNLVTFADKFLFFLKLDIIFRTILLINQLPILNIVVHFLNELIHLNALSKRLLPQFMVFVIDTHHFFRFDICGLIHLIPSDLVFQS